MPKPTITTTVEIDLDIKTAAEWFSALSDEQQAEFFIQAAEAAKKWKCQGHWGYQFWLAGRHLRDCDCSNDDARQLIREIADGMEPEQSAAAA